MRRSRRAAPSPDPEALAAAGQDDDAIDDALRKRHAEDRGLPPSATWDEITAHDTERRRTRSDQANATGIGGAQGEPAGDDLLSLFRRSGGDDLLARTDSSDAGLAAAAAQRNVELEATVASLRRELQLALEKSEMLAATFTREKQALQEERISEARERLELASVVAEQLGVIESAADALVDAVPIDQGEALRAPQSALVQGVERLRGSVQSMAATEQQLVDEADEAPPVSEVGDAASRAGLSEAEAAARQQELVGVSGVSQKRASELLMMADFDVNRAAEFHFTPTAEEGDAPAQQPLGGAPGSALSPGVTIGSDGLLAMAPAFNAGSVMFGEEPPPLSPAVTSPSEGAGGASPAVLDGLQLVKLVTIQAMSRGSLARRSHRKRSQVAQELLLTERSYYQGLRTLIDVYLSPLTQLSNAGHDAEIPAAQRRAIFGEVAALAELHSTQLLAQLVERLDAKRWCASTVLGDIFSVQTIELLKIHQVWANNYFTALTALRSMKEENPHFREWLLRQQQKQQQAGAAGGGGGMGLALEDYLIMPIQRIPRYVMLLKELLRCTTPHHPDHSLLSEAIERVGVLAQHVNESKRAAESRERVTAISEAFSRAGKKKGLPAGFELMSAARTWLRDGEIWEIDMRADLKLRTCFVFNDLLVKAEASECEGRLEAAVLRYCGMLPLNAETAVERAWMPSPFYKRGKKAAASPVTGRIDPHSSPKIPIIKIAGSVPRGSGRGGETTRVEWMLVAKDEQSWEQWHRSLLEAISWQSKVKRQCEFPPVWLPSAALC